MFRGRWSGGLDHVPTLTAVRAPSSSLARLAPSPTAMRLWVLECRMPAVLGRIMWAAKWLLMGEMGGEAAAAAGGECSIASTPALAGRGVRGGPGWCAADAAGISQASEGFVRERWVVVDGATGVAINFVARSVSRGCWPRQALSRGAWRCFQVLWRWVLGVAARRSARRSQCAGHDGSAAATTV